MSEGGPTIPAVPESEGTASPRGSSPSDRDSDPPVPDPVSRPSPERAGSGKRGSLTESPVQIQRAAALTLPELFPLARRGGASTAAPGGGLSASAPPGPLTAPP